LDLPLRLPRRGAVASVNAAVRAQARKAYDRSLCLAQRIECVQLCLLATMWYVAQILPPLAPHTQQLPSICSWFVWKGAIFWVPVTTLQQPKERGTWAISDIAIKCRTLLLSRLWKIRTRKDTVTAAMLRQWNLAALVDKPSFANHIPVEMAYVRHYVLDIAYITPTNNNETMHKFRKRLYAVLRDMVGAAKETATMPITRKHPGTQWTRVWSTFHDACFADSQKSTWNVVMHELILTNLRLVSTHVAKMDRCTLCGNINTLQHRLTECRVGPVIWNLTRSRLAAITLQTPDTYRRNGRCARTFNSGPLRNSRR